MLSNVSRTAARRAALTRTFTTTPRAQVAKIQIAGVVGNDIDVIETQNGTQIGNYSVASGPQDKTSWFRITAFSPSDYVRERVKKGALVFVDGDVSIDKYQDEASGKTLSSIRIVQSRVHILRNPVVRADAEAEAVGA